MTIILTHTHPDFDAIASAYAAYLYHDADHIAVITNYENNVLDFLRTTNFALPVKRYTEEDVEQIDTISTLVITDCKQIKRLGKLSYLIDKADKIILYDHHLYLSYATDIKATEERLRDVGSATTILVGLLQKKNIKLTKDEATLLALGVYEDTGSLIYNSTKEDDILAAAYLLKSGAELSVVAEHIKREMNRLQIFILNELLNNLSFITVSGISTAVTFASVDEYFDEAASLAQRLMAIEALDSLFILLSTGGRVVLVGRSKTEFIDVSRVVSEFGGGGHRWAGSAIIKDMMLAEANEQLKSVLAKSIKPVKTAADIMTSPVKFINSRVLLKDALDITMRYNLNNMPVLEKGKTIGIIARKDLLYGIKHGLQDEPISNIMNVEFDTISPNYPYTLARELMVTKGYKILPVEDDKKILGVITRTDLLRIMSDEIIVNDNKNIKVIEHGSVSKVRNIKSMLDDNLSDDVKSRISEIVDFANAEKMNIYLVGGFVRDLIMKRKNYDLDFVVEGNNTIEFATRYANKIGAKVSVHDNYKTASVKVDNDNKIDFATARTEYYNTPAAIPTVEEASIRNDLFRRDFTVNAMAIRLDGESYGQLIDYFSGQRDIQDKRIRVLHSLSFVDDPSRAFRAIRFAVRFDYSIGSQTERLLKHAVSLTLFDRLLGSRLFQELKLILKEPSFITAIEMMKRYDLLKFFHEKIQFDDSKKHHYEKLGEFVSWYNIQFAETLDVWKIRFYILISNLTENEAEELTIKLEISSKAKDFMLDDHKHIKYGAKYFKKIEDIKPSDIYSVCCKISTEAVIVLSVMMDSRDKDIAKDYLLTYRNVVTETTGDDLIKLGIKKGSLYKQILLEIKLKKIDGILKNADEELAYVREKYIKTKDKK